MIISTVQKASEIFSFAGKEKPFSCSPETLMNEAPAVIGIFSVALSSGRSLESAARDVAAQGPKNMSRMFSAVVSDADCRALPDIKGGLLSMISRFPIQLAPFRRAMHIVITAFESSKKEDREAMMKGAETIVLEGLRSMGEKFSSGLSTPCMVVFGLGIMLPMIMISVLPMLSIGGTFSIKGMDSKTLSFVTLVAIPSAVALVIVSLKGKNPFFSIGLRKEDLRFMLPMLSVIPAYVILSKFRMESNDCILYSFVVGGLLTALFAMPTLVRERERLKSEDALKDALFDFGNRLSMRENFDRAIIKSLSSRKECSHLSDMMEKELDLCRGDTESAIARVIRPISQLMAGFYCDVYRASKKDLAKAGSLATNLAHQLQDQETVKKGIENKLRSMLDMMVGTAAVFAPLILGMTVVMMGPISSITGTVLSADIRMLLTVYLIELSGLIAALSSNLMCKGSYVDIQNRFCLMMPIGLLVFRICCTIVL